MYTYKVTDGEDLRERKIKHVVNLPINRFWEIKGEKMRRNWNIGF